MTRQSRLLILAFCMLGASVARADPPPAIPTYLAQFPDRQWTFAERLWRAFAPCSERLCEGGYRNGSYVLSLDRQQHHLRIVAGFPNCAQTSWNDIDLTTIQPADRAERIGALIASITAFAARGCNVTTPVVEAPPIDRLFPEANSQ